MRKSDAFYPYGTGKFLDSSPSYLIDTFFAQKDSDLMQDLRTMQNANLRREGIQVHKALEDAFKHIQQFHTRHYKGKKGRAPGQDEVDRVIREALEKSDNALTFDKARASRPFVKEVVESLAPDILKNHNRRVYVEENIVSDLTTPRGMKIGGIPDLIVEDTTARMAKIFDWKTFGDLEFTRGMDRDYLKKLLQTRMYIPLVMSRLGALDVNMTYLFNKTAFGGDAATGGAASTEVHIRGRDLYPKLGSTAGYSTTDMRAMAPDISDILDEMDKKREDVFSRGMYGQEEDLKKYFRALIEAGVCQSGGCANCRLRFQCKRSTVKAQNMARGYGTDTTGYKSIKSILNKHKHDEQYRATLKQTLKDTQVYQKSMLNKRFTEIEQSFRNSVPVSRDSSEVEKAIARQKDSATRFHRILTDETIDKIYKGTMALEARLPWSIVDPVFTAPFATPGFKRTIDRIITDRVTAISETLGSDVNQDVLFKQVRDNLYHRERFVQDFVTRLEENAGRYLRREGVELPRDITTQTKLLNTVSRQFQDVIDSDMVNLLVNEIDGDVANTIISRDYTRIRQAYPHITADHSVKDIAGSVLSTEDLKVNPEGYMKRFADAGTKVGVAERSRFGAGKFPLPLAMATGALAYMAGVVGIERMISRKMDRAAEMVNEDVDHVRQGDHLSTSGTIRRMTLSDFGSPYVKYLNNSQMLSGIMTWGKSAAKTLKDTISRSEVLTVKNISTRYPKKTKEYFKVFADKLEPQFMLPAAVGSAVLLGLLPNVQTSASVGAQIDERRDRLRRIMGSEESYHGYMREPESMLRSSYKVHSPFGSPTLLSLANIGRFAPLTRDISSMMHIWKEGLGSLLSSFNRNILNPVDGEMPQRVVTSMFNKAQDTIKRGFGIASGKMQEFAAKQNLRTQAYLRKDYPETAIQFSGTKAFMDNMAKMGNRLKDTGTTIHTTWEKATSKIPIMVEKARKAKEYVHNIFRNSPSEPSGLHLVNNRKLTPYHEILFEKIMDIRVPAPGTGTRNMSDIYKKIEHINPQYNNVTMTTHTGWNFTNPEVNISTRNIRETGTFIESVKNHRLGDRIAKSSIHYPNKRRIGLQSVYYANQF